MPTGRMGGGVYRLVMPWQSSLDAIRKFYHMLPPTGAMQRYRELETPNPDVLTING